MWEKQGWEFIQNTRAMAGLGLGHGNSESETVCSGKQSIVHMKPEARSWQVLAQASFPNAS